MMAQSHINIAIADDNDIFRQGLKKTIESFEEFAITSNVESCTALFNEISTFPGAPDICIIDISMPESYEALKILKEDYPNVKVLILSVLSNELNIIRTIKIGANGFLLKGCSAHDLYKALVSIHNDGNFFTGGYNSAFNEKISHESLTYHLSYTELDMISHLCTEASFKEIAKMMGMNLKDSEKCRDELFGKIHVKNRVELILFAVHTGMLSIGAKRF